MGQAACIIIINGNKAYGVVENLAEKYKTVNVNMLEAAIEASCSITPYVSLYLEINGNGGDNEVYQEVVNLHSRIINELPVVDRANAQSLVDELTSALFSASKSVGDIIKDD